jgi:hypothetical protein
MLQNRPYNELVDVWAAGILLYIMCDTLVQSLRFVGQELTCCLSCAGVRLSGTLPFYADNPDDFLELVLSSSFSFPDSEWADVGEEGELSLCPTALFSLRCSGA